MKKLIIAMSVATMAALCAQAEVPEGYISGIDFQKTALGNLNVTAPDEKDGPVLWATTATLAEGGKVESTVVAESEEQNANKFLKIDETVPLQRLVNTEPTNVVAGIEISSRVQFTAADEAQEPDDGDKLLVWMQAAAEAEGTEGESGYKPAKKAGVMVTDATGTTMIKELEESEVEAFTAAWHTLVIRSTVTGEEGLETLAFKVTLDGVVADKTFASLVDSTVASATTISSIGFQGTGAVDDIGFRTFTEVVENNYKVGETEYLTFEDALAAALASNATITLLKDVTIAAGLTIGSEEAETQPTVTIDLAGKKMKSAAVTITCYGNLTIKDTVGGGSVETTFVPVSEEDEVISVLNGGKGDLVIMGGKYKGMVVGATLVTVPNAAAEDEYELALDEGTGYYEIKKIGGGESTTTYTITTATVEGATISVDKSQPEAGETVTVTVEVTAEEKVLDYITVNAVKIEGNTFVASVDAEVSVVLKDKTYAITTATVEGATITVDKTEAKKGATVTVTVEVTDETKQLDYITVGGVKIDGTTFEVTGTAEVSAVLKAIPTYTVTADAVDGATVKFSTTDAVVSGTTVTFEVEVTDTTKEIDTVKAGETELTATEGVYSVTVADANIVITVTLKAKQGGETLPTYLEGASEAAKAAYNTWAAANGVVDTASQYEEAFLLNCAPTDVATEKAAFKLSIEMVNGEAVVTTPEGKSYNGNVVIKSYKDVTCTVEGTGEKATFYKATLEVEKAAN